MSHRATSILDRSSKLYLRTASATAALLLTALAGACVQEDDDATAAEPTTSVATSALAALIPESVSVGTSVDLDYHAAEEQYALPPGQAMIEIVGIAIATANDHVYTWFADGTVSQGYSKDLDLYAAPQPYTLPGTRTPKDVLGMGIGSDGRTYTWYRDGMTSSGSTTNLGAYGAPIAFTVAAGETFDDLIAIDIASDDRVYAWYKDGKRSIGTRTDLDAHSAAVAYTLPPNQTTAHICETAISSTDKTYTWFQDLEHGHAWPALSSAVDGIIVERMRRLTAAGISVAISKDGRIVLDRAYGYRDVDTQEARLPTHASFLGSVSKVIAGLGVTKHAEQSPSFSLNSPVYGSNGVLSDLSYTQAMVAGINRHKPLVGFGIAPTNRVYGWYENQTVSWGSSADLDATSGPAVPFTMPPGKTTNDILGMALDSDGAVTTWYLDGTYSVGTPLDLDSVSSGTKWAPASGASVTEVLGLAIRKSDDRVYAWYADGTYSSGSAAELDSVSARAAYSLPAGKTMFDLRDADFANTGVIYFHYGTSVSQGNASDLDSASGLYSSSLASAPIVNDWLSWYGAIQVRHLLNHSAGLWGSGDDDGASRMFGVPAADLTYQQNNQFILSTRRLLWAPGTNDQYSNHSIGLAGHVLSVASGMPYETFIRTKILNPLGLTRIVPNGRGDVAFAAMPHHTDSTGHLVSDPLAPADSLNGLAAGGYSATAGDMVRLLLATDKLPNHPDILAPSSLTLMETPPFPATVPGRALSWDYAAGKLGKGGDISGGNAYIAKFPAGFLLNGVDVGGMTIALCANGGATSNDLRGLADLILTAGGSIAIDPSYDLY